MSPEVVALDEMPDDDTEGLDSDIPAGAVPCPECGEYFKSRGLSRHMSSAHGIEPERRQSTGGNKVKAGAFATQWAEFQRGAALIVSFACSGCAAVLMEDAVADGVAIASFCETRPKLRKQVQQALSGMDVMILVGALGGTARKMVAHHSIGARLGLASESHTHAPVSGSAEQKMMAFLAQMPEAERNLLLNDVFGAMAQQQQPTQRANTEPTVSDVAKGTAQVTLVHDDEVPGQPPAPAPEFLTENDRYQMAMAHSGGTDFVDTL